MRGTTTTTTTTTTTGVVFGLALVFIEAANVASAFTSFSQSAFLVPCAGRQGGNALRLDRLHRPPLHEERIRLALARRKGGLSDPDVFGGEEEDDDDENGNDDKKKKKKKKMTTTIRSNNKKTRKSRKSGSSSSSSSLGGGISSELAKWAAASTNKDKNVDEEEEEDTAVAVPVQVVGKEEEDASQYRRFEPSKSAQVSEKDDDELPLGKSKRRKKKRQSDLSASQRLVLEGHVDQLVNLFDDDFGEKDPDEKGDTKRKAKKKRLDMEELVQRLETLVEFGQRQEGQGSSYSVAANLKAIATEGSDFRLLWVGSDDAICHVGTGLHKVPLARLQEMFLSLREGTQVEVQEVIRVLGPFPNVKNVIRGRLSSLTKKSSSTISITYTSMLDGTGKELMSNSENKRVVPLEILFADVEAIVARVPSTNEETNNPTDWKLDLKKILVFVGEDEMPARLQALRVS